MGKTYRFELSKILAFQGFSGSSHALAAFSNIFKYVNLAEDMKKALEGNPPNIGWYVWPKLSRRVENRFATYFL